jgi:hypothetical protein
MEVFKLSSDRPGKKLLIGPAGPTLKNFSLRNKVWEVAVAKATLIMPGSHALLFRLLRKLRRLRKPESYGGPSTQKMPGK